MAIEAQVPHSMSLDTIVGEGLLVTMVWEWEFRLSVKPLLIPSGWKRQKCLISAPHMATTDVIGGGGDVHGGGGNGGREASLLVILDGGESFLTLLRPDTTSAGSVRSTLVLLGRSKSPGWPYYLY